MDVYVGSQRTNSTAFAQSITGTKAQNTCFDTYFI